MNSYNSFAEFYDCLTENVDYKVRSEYISNFFSRYAKGKRLLDLACGTGTFSRLFSDMGYLVTGIDLSEDMLVVASSKCEGVSFYKGDMTDFHLPKTFDCCLCSLDTINHLTDIELVKACFKCVYDALDKDGIFVFDANTLYKHNVVLDDNSFIFDYDEVFLAWDNENLGENRERIILDFFKKNGGFYERFTEELEEKAYSVDELKDALEGFEVLDVYDDMTMNAPHDTSERLYFVCRRK
jgi:predicted TPR repeat methyltransferase